MYLYIYINIHIYGILKHVKIHTYTRFRAHISPVWPISTSLKVIVEYFLLRVISAFHISMPQLHRVVPLKQLYL